MHEPASGPSADWSCAGREVRGRGELGGVSLETVQGEERGERDRGDGCREDASRSSTKSA